MVKAEAKAVSSAAYAMAKAIFHALHATVAGTIKWLNVIYFTGGW